MEYGQRLIANLRVQSQASSCGICGGQTGIGASFFSEYFGFPLSVITPQVLLFYDSTVPSVPGPPYWVFTITLRHTPIGMSPLDEWLVWRRDLYLTTHNTHNKHSFCSGIRNRNSRKRVDADPRLRLRDVWDRLPMVHSLSLIRH
jgi:hypothetical protein